jgi:hypothetical protein
MKTAIYIVLHSRDAWWIDLDGEAQGPFASLDVTIRTAIDIATAASRAGKRAEVRVMGPGHDNALVYQSADRSLLARAVAMNQHAQSSA